MIRIASNKLTGNPSRIGVLTVGWRVDGKPGGTLPVLAAGGLTNVCFADVRVVDELIEDLKALRGHLASDGL